MVGMLVRMAMSGALLTRAEALDLGFFVRAAGSPLPRQKRRRRWSAKAWDRDRGRSFHRRSRAYPERGVKRGGRVP